MAFLRQVWTLTSKNLKIVILRHPNSTFIRALILPMVLAAFFSYARNFSVPPGYYGIGEPRAVRTLEDSLAVASETGRETVVFVNNGLEGGDIDRVIDTLAGTVTRAGKNATRLVAPSELGYVCHSSLRGATSCYGAVVFHSSPSEGDGGIWNYTLRADGALGSRIDVRTDSNDAQIYSLPLQRAVDSAIASLEAGGNDESSFPSTTEEYPFTPMTQEEREEAIRELYQQSISNFMGVAFILVMIGVCYHMTGHMALEREAGMSQLLDAMLPTKYGWQPQVVRLLSHHIAFTLVYLPGWVIGSLIVWVGVFANSNPGILIVHFVLSGFALSSLSILGAAFFKKSQLSGIMSVIAYLLLAILAQALTSPNTATVAVLSLLFTPCSFTWFITWLARFQRTSDPADLGKAGPNSPWTLPGIVLWVFLVIQIFAYPMLGAYLEKVIHGSTSKGRTVLQNQTDETAPREAVRLQECTKIYSPNPIRRLFSFISAPRDPVVAVDKLTLTAGRGEILALLGANGSGKSTMLDSIAGISGLTSGKITIDGTGGLGIAPQKNVMWDDLTVEEHIKIFNRLKAPGKPASKEEMRDLVRSIDLGLKAKAMSKTLSGGQKRKLQLGIMLTGGSSVCCVDEVSSGIDPLSRRKIWDILLAERGKRTIILTTHFLDEADLLADHIVILSKGTLRASGSSVELKDRLGAGYRIHVLNARDIKNLPEVEGVQRKISFDVASYIAPSSSLAARVVRELEGVGIHDYKFSGPTIEDVFLQVAEEVKDETAANTLTSEKQPTSEENIVSDGSEVGKEGVKLLSGQRSGYWKQTWVLLRKRATVFKTNWFPYVAAFLIPVVAAALTQLYVTNQAQTSCTPTDQDSTTSTDVYADFFDNLFLVAGPSSQFTLPTLQRLYLPVFGPLMSSGELSGGASGGDPAAGFADSLHFVDSLDDFYSFVEQNRRNVTPAGWYLGTSNTTPTVAYEASLLDIYTSILGQNALNIMLANTSIATTFAPFGTQWAPSTGDSLNLFVYFCLALCATPAFFGLYPNIERRRNVRGLQYSNGVRSLPLWVSHIGFDFAIIVVSMGIAVAIFAAASEVWYHVGYLFVIFALYGAGSQAVGFLIYFIAYLSVNLYTPVNIVEEALLIVHFVISAVFPIGSVFRALFVALNIFSTACDGFQLSTEPGSITSYGGPVLYLIIQSILLFGFLLWYDSGVSATLFNRFKKPAKTADDGAVSDEVANELTRVISSAQETDGLQVVHLTKSFGKHTAVDNVTFGVQRSEVFALLGPNGAGKSTTISLIRGDIRPSRNGGDVFVEDISISRHRAAARANLGVCPQFDAIDSMTVLEHLRFYARIRGIPHVEHNVQSILRAVGLEAFSTRMGHALSGGNKRKLSLGIALMGNPSVLLLDEPSSGLDAAAKRIMWRTLGSVTPGRSILLTTHSMEEADALASRAGILAKRMLAIGSVDNLRHRFGDALHVHLVSRSAPHSPPEEMETLRAWVVETYPAADIEKKTYHGQMRFSIPASAVTGSAGKGEAATGSAIGQLLIALEEHKEKLGIEHYSISPTTLDQVFLKIVGKHNVQEEGHEEEKKPWWKKGW
ncbi:hypothetical protein DL764_008583 [Monosporascus ibericus]|uniref:ABC transporter domain-containing protein n=1 Tax=Monosporascus ibericus TaxID=155417 RepID=A0A4Q4SX41_9PEZI|nr:hypothetical protein DL764_008583 [Monosporascus ibericus]